MLKNNPFLDDMAKLAGGAAGSMLEMRKELEALITAKAEQYVSRMQLVTREEFEVALEMAQKARLENDELKQRVADLEAKIAKSGQ